MSDVKDVKAALERGSGIVLVSPPAPERAAVWDLAGPGSVIVCADQVAALDWVAAAPPSRSVHAVTGLARSARLLKSASVDIIAGSIADIAALVARSALKLAEVPALVLAWPEALAQGEQAQQLDELLAEAGNARRIVLSWNPGQLTDFLERHAHRAPIFGALPLDPDGRPLRPVASARFVITTPDRRLTALRDVLDAVDPPSAVVWTPDPRHAARLKDLLGGAAAEIVTEVPAGKFALVVCARMPGREELVQLVGAGPVVVLAAPYQLPYLRGIAALEAVRLPTAADRARERTAGLHDRIVARLTKGEVDPELAALAPLFERFDPAEVAAALLALRREDAPEAVAVPSGEAPRAWTKVFVGVGRRDKAAAKDLVGAMTRELGIAKAEIGKVDVQETFSLVEIAPQRVESVISGLSRVTIRGRRVTARLDRPR